MTDPREQLPADDEQFDDAARKPVWPQPEHWERGEETYFSPSMDDYSAWQDER